MVLDDDPRVLDSLLPGLAIDLARAWPSPVVGRSCVGASRARARAAGPGEVPPTAMRATRLAAYRHRSHQVHLHLVRESRGGRFDLAPSAPE
jgi:hypothetical protein